MERWKDRVAVVTGSNSGIGTGIARALVQNGLRVVGMDRTEISNELKSFISGDHGKFYFYQTNLRKEKEIIEAFGWIANNLGAISVFVNNAGLTSSVKKIEDGITDEWRNVLDVNILAVTICTREALKSMKRHVVEDGHIINICSILSHVSRPIATQVMYCASKKAVMAVSEGVRRELILEGSKIRVSTICPGMVDTNIMRAVNHSFAPEKPKLLPEDVAQTVLFCLQVPPHVQISDIVVHPVGENLQLP
ncbi:dehydrogenase/reductase SDR family member 11-like [Nilaparvata lugens]|uniref:dehydrogenase/reductase SDR family member 11-like n=1 Tax=Nilaparvata lugens TaxID=108931 RepID=UPI00193E4F0C|nr:dehydrogenase/reductase SDR family member 11-like [Nilaparvata lugens]